MDSCVVCEKHRELHKWTGPVIMERGGWVLTHFPNLETEAAGRGHLLLETRRHISEFTEMSADESGAFGDLVRVGSEVLKTLLGAEHVYLFRINDKVQHLHVHLIPRYPDTPREFWGVKIMEYSGRPIATYDEIISISKILAEFLRSPSPA